MIRILFNYNCNLYCSYCFEKHLWPKKDYITPEELKTILQFGRAGQEVYIVGGEPTLNPHFLDLCKTLKEVPQNINYLLSNGIFHKNFQEPIINTFKIIMFNINDPKKYTDLNWNILENNLKAIAVENTDCLAQVGINIYDKNQRFEYLIPIMQDFKIIRELRVSMVNPNYCFSNQYLDLKGLKEAVPVLLNLISLAKENNFELSLDCPLPPCIFSREELLYAAKYVSDFRFSGCEGGMTFYPGLKIGHCFASYPDLYDLKNYQGIEQIEEVIMQKERKLIAEVLSFPECENCFFKNTQVCQGGCLAFKVRKIIGGVLGEGM